MKKLTITENGYILKTNFRFAADMFMLFDKNGDFLEKSSDFESLNNKLIAMGKTKENDVMTVPFFPYKFGQMLILN